MIQLTNTLLILSVFNFVARCFIFAYYIVLPWRNTRTKQLSILINKSLYTTARFLRTGC